MITIIDYGIGNLGSLNNMLKKASVASVITSEPEVIEGAEKLILPGVGSFDHGMHHLLNSGLLPILEKRVLQDKVPILGVCLGAQLMTRGSEEGELPGLGWIEGNTVKFDKARLPQSLKIPHMGWGDTKFLKEHKLFADIPEQPRFYYVHSYHFALESASDKLAEAKYGYDFPVAFARDNIAGVQFHPEKSHKFGLKLLYNFATLL
ncbi:imidazole glycerol phosphate synthase subunit HisH [Pontibacter cellulosilyticus]|uniref:Imidazole glycerol phosphate synthase subunit HisH n=1 Tax=Pontibacter cellulosilyticus TaxID=1720253 RepID=A0A923SHD0_9BACT|nr:imidazole glycerol phosphate synthase subunit HisH [Pontibacter cellulosilyticus]MBC5991614.1 imidazole glycerol phosphate synthase subunit HisH [Pontibacter cellulosilyticus]